MRNFFVAIAVSVALPMSVSAQSFQPGGQYSNNDRRVSVGLTIPFGGGGSHTERLPRLDLAVDHRRRDAHGFAIRELAIFKSQRPVRLGFTLSEKPQMILNGRAMSELNNRKNISTGVWIGVGVVAALGLGLLVVVGEQHDRCSGPNGSGGCDG
jgi:hypothetical protein